MKCEDFELSCADYPGGSTSEFNDHLNLCEKCAAYLESVKEDRRALAAVTISAPADFEKNLYAKLAQRRRRSFAGIAAALLIGIGVGILAASATMQPKEVVRTEYVRVEGKDSALDRIDPKIAALIKCVDEQKLKIVNRYLWEISRMSSPEILQ